ncbi:MscL family protein [Mycoplasmopsis citelli]|uniref:Large conductance mechanosensitive channel protein n=1 Tax=Mycoplasmopsis citelli TaxID=171281 RepID=A0A449B1D9_9BACT|nr:MscL family protein [Mycoplasmopsis citelli]UUD35848.1 MscL family protein [Mycoplasmopsis citelli]VEU74381.1 large conductance mechanosensitive channel protein [Mycoplasmopsis citelli]
MKKLLKLAIKDAKGHLKKGNIFMLAVAFILGTVFGSLVSSFANDILMGLIASLVGKTDSLDALSWKAVKYGKFLGALIYFLVVSAFIFVFLVVYFSVIRIKEKRLLIKNPVVPEQKASTPAPTTEELILAELKSLNENLTKE